MMPIIAGPDGTGYIIIPSGERVDFCSADVGTGPHNCFGPLKLNSTGHFARINEGPWRRAEATSMHKLREHLQCCEDVADVNEILRPEITA